MPTLLKSCVFVSFHCAKTQRGQEYLGLLDLCQDPTVIKANTEDCNT